MKTKIVWLNKDAYLIMDEKCYKKFQMCADFDKKQEIAYKKWRKANENKNS